MIGLVAGFGLCGSSLVMAMLKAGGLPVVGLPPIYEVAEFNPVFTDWTFLQRHDGHILKWLDPLQTVLPACMRGGPVLWLDRDPSVWAESHLKLRNFWYGTPMRNDIPILHADLVSQVQARTLKTLAMIEAYGPVQRLAFEKILADPIGSAQEIASCFRPFGPLDVDAASRMVKQRDPSCAEGMEFTAEEVFATRFPQRFGATRRV